MDISEGHREAYKEMARAGENYVIKAFSCVCVYACALKKGVMIYNGRKHKSKCN